MGCLLLLFRIVLCLHFLLFHFPSFSFSSHFSTPFCHPDQSSALLQFKRSLTVNTTDPYFVDVCPHLYPKIRTWENGTNCCSWMGVTCDSKSGHVIELDLSCSRLEGNIHPNSTLFHLTHLQRLNLAHNYFYESPLPSQFGGFVSLTHLNLSDCWFKGDIPSQISHLSQLASLDLSWNYGLKLKETTWKRLLQNATALREILLDYTNMSSISPSPLSLIANLSSSLVTLSLVETGIRGHLTSDVLCLPSLQEVDLSYNGGIQVHLPKLNCSTSLSILDLSECQFQGSIIPSSFSNLTHLTSLTLMGSNLNGSIPSSLSNLQHLIHLDLSENKLSGSIPLSLSNLQHLIQLDLSSNELNSSIPSSFSNLQHLIHLALAFNKLSGQIPDMFGGLTKLQTLILRKNSLGGKLPYSLFTLTQLSTLDCSLNKLEGPLPNKIAGFSNLTELYLYDNLLNGTIPSWCLSLPSLTSLYLENNRFTGYISAISSYSLESLDLCGNKLQGNIPESIFNLVNLFYLCLSSDDRSGPVHFPLFSKLQGLQFLSLSGYNSLSLKSKTIVNYTYSNLETLQLRSNNLIGCPKFSGKFPNLNILDLSNNNLQGKVPKWILDIDSLIYLNLSQNQLTSADRFSWFNLEYLDLSSNLMTDNISSIFCNASSLQVVNLSRNKFTGTIPQCLANLSYLEILDLQMNKLHGNLSSTFSMNKYLETLNLYGNQLEGHLPKSLSNCTYLEVLNLGNNQIEDTFPHWLPMLAYLKVLVLRGNKLYGPIASLKTKHPFPSLIIFDISCNNFSGPLPKAFIENFQAMKSVVQAEVQSDSSYMIDTLYANRSYGTQVEYDNSVIATIKGISITYAKIPTVFVNIDLSENKFEGEIPNIIGELHYLKGLNLSHNRLNGPIPDSMGNLTNLESLDLSSNMLTGGIPSELTNLNSLEVLNLSRNHLVGPIPQGKQFNTFSKDSYEGNTGLCGLPLAIQCNKDPEKQSPSSATLQIEDKFGFGWKPVAIGYGCGMVFGVGLGFCVLLIGKPQWLVRMVGGDPNKKVKGRRGMRTRGNRARMSKRIYGMNEAC